MHEASKVCGRTKGRGHWFSARLWFVKHDSQKRPVSLERKVRDTAETAMGQRMILSFLRLQGWSVKVRNLAIFSEIALALVSLPSCFLSTGDMKNFRMCHRPGERVHFFLGTKLERNERKPAPSPLFQRKASTKDHLLIPIPSCLHFIS